MLMHYNKTLFSSKLGVTDLDLHFKVMVSHLEFLISDNNSLKKLCVHSI